MRRLCVSVKFDRGGPGYTYFTPFDDHHIGDVVVVELQERKPGEARSSDSGHFAFARVSDAKPPQTMCDRATRWIVDRVNVDAYRARSALAPVIEGAR